MFDWFRDMALGAMGKNSDEEELKRREKKREQEKEKFIFSKNTKWMICAFGILYLIMGGMSLYVSIQIAKSASYSGAGVGVWKYIKYAVLSIIDISAMACLWAKGRKAEIISIVLIILFVILMYMSSVVLLLL